MLKSKYVDGTSRETPDDPGGEKSDSVCLYPLAASII